MRLRCFYCLAGAGWVAESLSSPPPRWVRGPGPRPPRASGCLGCKIAPNHPAYVRRNVPFRGSR